MCHKQKEARAATEEQEGDTDVETALALLNEEDDTDLEVTDVQEILLACKESQGVTTVAWRTASKPWPQTCDRAYQWRKA